jgi:MoxR-like ATPase
MHDELAQGLAALVDQVGSVVLGKRAQVEDCVACLAAGGHLLIEDLPGVGKTTLAQALARSLGLQCARVQFTADMMPSDLLGSSIWQRQDETFVFHPGPVFTQVLLADEINRAGPRTQGALLEAMEEAQVSVDGTTRSLPRPFFVIATQNPRDQHGTYPLPQGQLDRFLMCITLGLPDRAAERALLAGEDRRAALQRLEPVLGADALQAAQQAVQRVHVSDALLDYLQTLVAATRDGSWFTAGLSPRGALALLRGARARALMAGRGHVVPGDVQAVLPQVLAHRLEPAPGSALGARAQAQALLQAPPV